MDAIHHARRRRRRRIPDELTLGLQLRIGATRYSVRPVRCDAQVAERAFQLRKADGTHYDVAQTAFGPECDCPDYLFRRAGIDPAGCKHVRALVAFGLIQGHPLATATTS